MEISSQVILLLGVEIIVSYILMLLFIFTINMEAISHSKKTIPVHKRILLFISAPVLMPLILVSYIVISIIKLVTGVLLK